ncbi:hypothetical protein SLEP1_g24649 [Rubroshorea leprosula]|uniref:DUF4216 domain-containing protein n=1 Tax=Rubroshorea leprosula TaxID=152421 RepID=A0AAV5JQK5_9ROSI|nr:hypothetical protein SLEP1_g24649 [Rubroshorea leprosula]
MNYDVCVVGSISTESDYNFYGVLQEIIQIEYYESIHQQAIVLFKCDWYEIPPAQGVQVDQKHRLVDINPRRYLRSYEPFILASQARQVYYIPYPSINHERRGWIAALKIKARTDVGEGIGEEDEEEGEWEDFETLEEENIETYVEENDNSDKRVQEEGFTDVVLETPASDADIQVESLSDEDTHVATFQQRQGRGQAKPVQMPTDGTKIALELDEYREDLWSMTTKIKFKHALSELKAKCAKRNFQAKLPDMNPELWARLVYLWIEGHLSRFPEVYTSRRQHKGKGKYQLPIYCNDEAQEIGKKLTAEYATRQEEEGFEPTIAHGELLLRATGRVKKGQLKDNESLRQQQMTLAAQMQQLYQHLRMTPTDTSRTVTPRTPRDI